jgi:DNA (cytosine-5)-methyltransferase 1
MKSNRPTAVDLFCGMGGLTLGLKRAGFEVKAAIDVNKEFAKTYKANHPEVNLLTKDIRQATGKEILEAAGVETVDLVSGCPPCQGFSKLTDKQKGEDPRNELLIEMGRIVLEMQPRAVMMENVPGLFKRGKDRFFEFVKMLESDDYRTNYDLIPLADYGIPQSRTRLVLLAGKGFRIDFPTKTHAKDPGDSKSLSPWLTLRDVIWDMRKPVTLSKALKSGGPQRYNWHVIRDLHEISIRRLKALKAGQSRSALPKRLRPACHKKEEAGFVNVYARMSWKQLPPTITSGCLSPCMGRFGHPRQIRTISVREAALLQTFPRSYRIKTNYAETACNMVGNALPPRFAQLAGASCFAALKDNAFAHGATPGNGVV